MGSTASHQVATQAHAGPVLVQAAPQLSVPVVVCPQTGVAAEQLPSETQHAPQSAEHVLQVSVFSHTAFPQTGSIGLGGGVNEEVLGTDPYSNAPTSQLLPRSKLL